MPGKIVAFYDALSRLNELGRMRTATFQGLADEAFADLLGEPELGTHAARSC